MVSVLQRALPMISRARRACAVAPCLLLIVGLALLAGCQPHRRATTDVARTPFRIINVTGPYRHEASGMEFPTTVGEFTRTSLLQYDRAGRNISARYEIAGQVSKIVATIFVYPAPAVSGSMRTERCDSQLDSAAADMARTHPRLHRTGTDDVTLAQSGGNHQARRATFDYEERLERDEVLPSAAQIYLFCRATEAW